MAYISGLINSSELNEQNIKKMGNRYSKFGKCQSYYFDDNKAFGIGSNDECDIYENKDYLVIYDGNEKVRKVLSLYKENKYKIFQVLNGFFSCILFDKKNNELVIANDPWGSNTLYYYHSKDLFLFSTEIKCILEHPDYKKEFNEEILATYLCFNSVATDETFFKGIYKVPTGCYLVYKNNKITLKEYFKFNFKSTKESYEDLVKEIESSVKDSVRDNSKSNKVIGSFLSSGIDSSYLVSLLKPQHTFTIGYENKSYDELNYAKDLADKLGILNHERIVSKKEYIEELPNVLKELGSPISNPSLVPIYLLSKEASKYVDVVFSGEGADELFGGYNSYQEELTQSWYMKIPFFIRRTASFLVSFLPDIWGLNFVYRRGMKLSDYNIGLGRVFRDKEALSLLNNKDQIIPISVVKPYYDKYRNCTSLEQRQIIDYYFWLVNDFAYCVDKCSLLNNIGGATPYLDKRVFDVALKVPMSYKISQSQTKIILRDAASRSIPNDSYKKKKLGFPVPLRDWIKDDDYYQIIKEKFCSDTAKKYFNVNKLLKLLDNNKSGKVAEYKKIWTIYTFILWYELNFD